MGKKDEQMKQRAALAKEEKRAQIYEKMEEIGVSGSDPNWLPDDEIDEEDVQKSLWYTFKSMVPGTNEYYESTQAEEDLDDLKGIRIERAKANDLLALAKMGKHEEALAKMKMDTTNDYHYFNRLMQKMQSEGKWKLKPPPSNPFADVARGKNRLKKAINKQFNVVDEEALKALAAMSKQQKQAAEDNKGGQPPHLREASCTWRGKTRDGEFLQCTNTRQEHPYIMTKSTTGEDVLKVLGYCVYHVKECIGLDHRQEIESGSEAPVVKICNSEALCTECYMTKLGKAVPNMSDQGVPGVAPVTLQKTSKTAGLSEQDFDDTHESLTEDAKCNWRPSKVDSETILRGYICKNVIMRNPETNALIPTCGWHVKQCVRSHSDGSGVITIPNPHGLCSMHYLSEFGYDPPSLAGEYPNSHIFPGMIARAEATAWKRRAGHFAAPRWDPTPPVDIVPYQPPIRYRWIFEPFERADRAFNFTIHYFKKIWRSHRRGKLLQRTFRMSRVRNLHKVRQGKQAIYKRSNAALVIQNTMRMKLGKIHVQNRRKLFTDSVTTIQKHFRGYKTRRWFTIQESAKRITRVFRMNRQIKMRDGIIAVLQIKRLFEKKVKCILDMQRVIRGWMGRMRIRRGIINEFIHKRCSKIIQKRWRRYLFKKYRSTWTPPEDDWARIQCGKRISRLITNMLVERRRRRDLMNMFQKSSPEAQRLIRGFISRRGVKRMKYIRNAMNTWCKPKVAVQFLKLFIESKMFNLPPERRQGLHLLQKVAAEDFDKPSEDVDDHSEEGYIRKFLPAKVRNDKDLEHDDFRVACAAYYRSCNVPLLQTEVEALISRFKNPMNGKVMIGFVEDFISLHSQPCSKHGRYVCGVCTFHRECTKCSCTCYFTNAHQGAACYRCNHPQDLHRIVPLFLKKKSQRNIMQSILYLKREPDTGIPEEVEGVDATEFIQEIATVNTHKKIAAAKEAKDAAEAAERVKRLMRKTDDDSIEGNVETKMTDLELEYLEQAEAKRNLVLKFSSLHQDGNTLAETDEWWDQGNLSLVNLVKSYAIPLHIQSNPTKPHIDLTPEEFWLSATKVPNKTLRDYDDKFEHSLPMSIVTNKALDYTIDGSQVYLAVLIQIAKMDEEIPSQVHYDHPDFVRLVVDHMQIFERHWRKMVVDLRKGELNRNLKLPPETRKLYETTTLPKPALAKSLDTAFKELGFHKKVLGKDIKIRAYATPKHEKKEDPHERRLSLPDVTAKSKPMTNRQQQEKEPYELKAFKMSHAAGEIGLTAERTKLLAVGAVMNNGARENYLVEETERLSLSPSRRSRSRKSGRRRGSETDIVVPIGRAELNEMNYEAASGPMPINNMTELAQDKNRFICPFPACGCTFKNRITAFAHLKVHEQKAKLGVPTPVPDSFLHYYWPGEVPWLNDPQFQEKTVSVGAIECPVESCTATFISKDALEVHLKSNHPHLSRIAQDEMNNKYGEQLFQVPPYEPPENAPLEFCPNHALINGKCPVCLVIEKLPGPQPPYRFYSNVLVDKNKNKSKGNSGTVKFLDKKNSNGRIVNTSNTDRDTAPNINIYASVTDEPKTGERKGVFIRKLSETGERIDMVGIATAIMKDGKGVGWIAFKRYYTYNELTLLSLESSFDDIARDFDRAYELQPSNEEIDPWIPLKNVVENIRIMTNMSREDFIKDVKAGKKREKCFFVR